MCITDGLYRGRRILIFHEYPTDRSKNPKLIPSRNLMVVKAYMVFGYTYEFYGTKAVPIPPGPRSQSRLVARGDLEEKDVPYLLTPTVYAPLKDLISVEKWITKFVDEIFGDDILGQGEIEERLVKIIEYESWFRDSQEVLEFVHERPHLYYYNGHRAWVRSPVRRRMNDAVLGLLNVKKGKTLEQIQNALKAASDGDDLQLIFEQRLKDHIESLASLLIIKENPNRTIYSLKSHFDKKEKMLLPGYPRTNLPDDR